MTLNAATALRGEGDNLIVMLHYPPFEANLKDTAYTDLIGQYNPTAVVYGHLHGENVRSAPVVDKYGVPYYLTSCDKLDNKLLKIL
jgi:predicted phosphohydrolase